jgi:Leucine-rich repeat (LRR) protein
MVLTFNLFLLARSIFGTGQNESTLLRKVMEPTKNRGISFILRDIVEYLSPVDRHALTLSSRDLHEWRRRLILNKAKNSEYLDREVSLQLISSATLRAEVEEHYAKNSLSIYPIALTLHEDDVPLLENLDVFSFISRVQTVVFEGEEQIVIEAKETADVINEVTQRGIGMYDPNAACWTWNQPNSLMEVLDSDAVTAVKSLDLNSGYARFEIELSWTVREGNIKWTGTKTYPCLQFVKRDGIACEEILLNQKLRNLQALRLTIFDLSVLVNVSVLSILENLESLNLSWTRIVDVSALAQLTNLKVLDLGFTEVVDISALGKLTKLKTLILGCTKVYDISALANLKKLEILELGNTKVHDVSALTELTNLKRLYLNFTKVGDFSALKNKLPNLQVIH